MIQISLMSHSRPPSSASTAAPRTYCSTWALGTYGKKFHHHFAYHGQFHNKTKRDILYELLNPLCRNIIRISDQRNRPTLPTGFSGRLFSTKFLSIFILPFLYCSSGGEAQNSTQHRPFAAVAGSQHLEKLQTQRYNEISDNAGSHVVGSTFELNGHASRHAAA